MKIYFLSLLILTSFIVSCNKRNADYSVLGPEVLKEWRLDLNSENVIPNPQGRQDEGTVIIQVLSDNSVRYEYRVPNFASGDYLTGAGIYAGDPVSNGSLLLDLNARPVVPNATGGLTNLSQSLIDSLLNDNIEKYISVRSNQIPTGALRAQINRNVVFGANVLLTGAEEVPPVNTTATGVSSLRLSANGILYSRIDVTNVEPTDQLTMAHIHRGARGVNGPIVITLASSPADFGVTQQIPLSDSLIQILSNERLYVNVHSVLNPAGKIRGQIR